MPFDQMEFEYEREQAWLQSRRRGDPPNRHGALMQHPHTIVVRLPAPVRKSRYEALLEDLNL